MTDGSRTELTTALPTTVAELMARRKGANKLKDLLVPTFGQLISDVEFRALLSATRDEDAVEGKRSLDDVEAARRMRVAASEVYPELKGVQLREFIKALNSLRSSFVMRRKDLSEAA